MKTCLFRLAFLAAFFVLVGPSPAIDILRRERREAAPVVAEKKDERKYEKAKTAYEVETVHDIAYRDDRNADPARHRLDLYLPRGARGFPVILFVHGGSWRSGDKGEYDDLGEMLAGEGIGTVIINYRLSPKVQHPAHIEDVASAFGWTQSHIAKYGGRPDRIFAVGHSAGGHLVSLLSTDEKYLKKEGLSLKDVRGVIAISGVHSIMPIVPLYHAVFGRDREDCREASPLNHVGKTCPPFLLMYGDHDLPTLGRMAEEMNLELKKYKCETDCVRVDHRNHMTILLSLMNDGDEARQAILNFIARHSEWKPTTNPDAKDGKRRESRKRDLRKKDEK